MIRIKTKKKFAQHFLKNEKILHQISLTHLNKKNILEIGPGTGALTKYLIIKRSNLVLIEIDSDCINYLNKNFKNIKIINDDILQVNFLKIFKSKFSVISNLPYNISSQVFFKVLEYRDYITEFTFLLQKEVAQRICSNSGKKTYGILSVLIQTFYKTDYILEVGPKEFDPPPKVDSALITGLRNKTINIGVSFNYFKKIVKQSFQNRRKTLRNSLKNLNLPKKFVSQSIFSKRAEQLDIKDFIWLTNQIKKIQK